MKDTVSHHRSAAQSTHIDCATSIPNNLTMPSALTLELRLAAESPEAKQKAGAAEERMKMRGRKPGWSLLLNPSPAVLEDSGCTSADVLRRMIEARERMAIGDYYRDLDDGTPGHEHDL